MKKHSFALTCALLLSTFAAAHGGMEHVMGNSGGTFQPLYFRQGH